MEKIFALFLDSVPLPLHEHPARVNFGAISLNLMVKAMVLEAKETDHSNDGNLPRVWETAFVTDTFKTVLFDTVAPPRGFEVRT